MTLDQLQPGDKATVVALDGRGPQRRRLMDLGLLPGAVIDVCMASPLGDPRAYLVRNSLIALRRAQARTVRIAAPDGTTPD